MSAYVEQELLIQLETALRRLVEGFWKEPYRFFTEADAVAALQSWVARRSAVAQTYSTADDFGVGLLHREYPTSFRLRMDDLRRRQEPPHRRGHYDLVVLDQAYAQGQAAEVVTNREIRDRRGHHSPPLLAAVEFKLFVGSWNTAQLDEVRKAAGKLRLALESPPDVGAAYLCIFQRDASGKPRRWEERWQEVVESTLVEFTGV